MIDYYNKIKHLRIAQGLVKDIDSLQYLLYAFNRKQAIHTVSHITLKYRSDLDKIGIYLSGRMITTGNQYELYHNYSDESLIDDINYLIDCLIVIGSVKYGGIKSLEEAINKIMPADE